MQVSTMDLQKLAAAEPGQLMGVIKGLGKAVAGAGALALAGHATDAAASNAKFFVGRALSRRRLHGYLGELGGNKEEVMGPYGKETIDARFDSLYRMSPSLMADPSAAAGLISESLRVNEHAISPPAAQEIISMEGNMNRQGRPGSMGQIMTGVGQAMASGMVGETLKPTLSDAEKLKVQHDSRLREINHQGKQNRDLSEENVRLQKEKLQLETNRHVEKMTLDKQRMSAGTAQSEATAVDLERRFQQQENNKLRLSNAKDNTEFVDTNFIPGVDTLVDMRRELVEKSAAVDNDVNAILSIIRNAAPTNTKTASPKEDSPSLESLLEKADEEYKAASWGTVGESALKGLGVGAATGGVLGTVGGVLQGKDVGDSLKGGLKGAVVGGGLGAVGAAGHQALVGEGGPALLAKMKSPAPIEAAAAPVKEAVASAHGHLVGTPSNPLLASLYYTEEDWEKVAFLGAMKNVTSAGAKAVGSAAKSVGSAVGNAAKSVGSGVSKAVKSVTPTSSSAYKAKAPYMNPANKPASNTWTKGVSEKRMAQGSASANDKGWNLSGDQLKNFPLNADTPLGMSAPEVKAKVLSRATTKNVPNVDMSAAAPKPAPYKGSWSALDGSKNLPAPATPTPARSSTAAYGSKSSPNSVARSNNSDISTHGGGGYPTKAYGYSGGPSKSLSPAAQDATRGMRPKPAMMEGADKPIRRPMKVPEGNFMESANAQTRVQPGLPAPISGNVSDMSFAPTGVNPIRLPPQKASPVKKPAPSSPVKKPAPYSGMDENYATRIQLPQGHQLVGGQLDPRALGGSGSVPPGFESMRRMQLSPQ